MSTKSKKRVVVVGGGTGTHTILRGLKKYTDDIDITAIVTMADSGGSTGRLRDEFGQLPVGDARMAMLALAAEHDVHGDLLRELFLYRFDKGEGLAGHNFGNLLLTALTDILGSSSEAIEVASSLLRINGRVLPVTTDNVHLMATYSNGRVIIGEHFIDEPEESMSDQRITALAVTPEALINPKAREAILHADLVVFGPGDLYTSILANCVVGGMSEAIMETEARIGFVCNLMSRTGQTIGMHTGDYVSELEKYTKRKLDWLIFNKTSYADDLVQKYLKEGNHPVENNYLAESCLVLEVDVVSDELFLPRSGDVLKRSLIRHDGDKLAKVIYDLIY